MAESELNEKKLAEALVPLVGNRENINEVTHCVTRLRFILEDETLADTEAIELLPGVVKALSSGGQYQVVIGTAVEGVHAEILEILAVKDALPAESLSEDGKTESLNFLTFLTLNLRRGVLLPENL